MNDNFKRVLLISNVPVTPYSAQGASRGSWFRKWDRESLAMMSFAKADKSDDFANHLFTVGLNEKFGGGVLKKILKQDSSLVQDKEVLIKPIKLNKKENTKSFRKKIKVLLGLFTYPKYSNDLKKFIKNFKPDIIFSTVADCYGARLAKFLSKKANIPYIIQQEDNWLVTDVFKGLLAKFVYKKRKSCLKSTLKNASKRYVICPSMKDHFESLFNLEFESLFCADDMKRFLKPVNHNPKNMTIFTYIGNSQPGRSPEFIKIAQAIKNVKIINPEFLIYSTNAYESDVKKLEEFGFVKFLDMPHHDDVPLVLSESNVLILTESFDEDIIEYTKLALSSKVQIYMMTKIPILIFASPKTGVMDYALKTKFAYAVTEDNIDKLEQAVKSITNNKTIREDIVNKALKVAKTNHDADIIRLDLKNTITDICDKGR
jgi:glycosyltransferase involved in cell wall biosynthesis